MIDLTPDTKLITRGEWRARAPRNRTWMQATDGTTFHHNGPPIGLARLLADHNLCFSTMRGTQDYHMDAKGWSDVAYNGCVCPHGFVFEGRWISTRSAAQGTNTGNASSYALMAFLGEGEAPPDAQLRGMWDGAAYLRAKGGAGANLRGHRYWHSTACPGDPIYRWIQAGCPRPGGNTPPINTEDDMTGEEHDLLVGVAQVLGVGNPKGTLLSGQRTVLAASQPVGVTLVKTPGDKVFVTNGLVRKELEPGQGGVLEDVLHLPRVELNGTQAKHLRESTVLLEA